MNNFKKDRFREGGRSSGGRPQFGRDNKFSGKFGGGRDRGDRSGGRMEMFPAVCAECRKSCEVPFRATGEKPVYCRDCFGSKKGGGDARGNGSRLNFSSRAPKRDFAERLRFQSDSRPDFKQAPVHDDTERQLAEINIKLDRLISAIEKTTEARKETPVAKIDFVESTTSKVKSKVTKKKAVSKKKK